MSKKTEPIDLIGRKLRLQWADILSEPMTNVLEDLLQRLHEAELKKQSAPLATINEAQLNAVLCLSDSSGESGDLVADLRAAIQRKCGGRPLGEW